MGSSGEGFSNPTLEAVRRVLVRYQPFIVTVTAIALIAILLPGRSNQSTEGTISDVSAAAPEVADTGTEETAAAADARTAGGGAAAGDARAAAPADTKVLTFEEARKSGAALVANCDSRTGRIMIPTKFAPPCTQRFSGTNAGATWQGLSSKTIKAVWFHLSENPATQSILAAAGADDSREEVEAQVRDWGKLYESHFNMWGRKVQWTFVQSTAPSARPDDDAAAKADAVKVAGLKPFVVMNSPANIFVDEMVAKKILCMCTVSLPIDTYIKWYPYVWTTLMASHQGYLHRAEYVKRILGKKAQWAYDGINPTQNYRSQTRKFGFIYYDTDSKSYKSGADFFIKHMKSKYGYSFCRECVSEYHGYPAVQRTQEEAPGIIQRMKAAGVNSIICACDPFGPIFFTKEAQQQLYGPEWIITGSALTDTSFFARLYQQDQWSHSFGISYLPARLPEEQSDSYKMYRWQFNREPPARAGYGVIRAPIGIFYNGVHMAGGALTPRTFAAGLQNLGIVGRGTITGISYSFGENGLWPWKIDTAAADDATEIWWDRNAEGEDEIGQDGRGLYRYVDGGRRYLPGRWPKGNPKAYVMAGTVTIYPKPPPADRAPCYRSPATGRTSC